MSKLLEMFRDTAIKAHIGFRHEGPWETCEWVECEDRRKVIDSETVEQRATPTDAEQLERLREAAEVLVHAVEMALATPRAVAEPSRSDLSSIASAVRHALGTQEGS